jgi:tetratricopeptide (TPR) repeat protein
MGDTRARDTDAGPANFPPLADALALAKRLAREGDFDAALTIWTRLRQLYPEHRGLVRDAAAALQAKGRIAEAAQWLGEAAERFSDDFGIALANARVATQRRDWDVAIDRWTGLCRKFPDRPDGYTGLAVNLRESGHVDEADRLLSEAVRQFRSDHALSIEYARLADRRRDWAAGITRWKDFRQRFPEHIAGYVEGAACLIQTGHFDEAEMVLGDAVARFSADLTIHTMWVEAAVRRKDWPVAAERAAMMRECLPQAAMGYVQGARALRELRQFDLAGHILMEGRNRLPNDVQIRRTEAHHAVALRDWSAADRLWAEVRAAAPNHVAGYIGGAEALHAANRQKDADALMLEATRLFPDHIPAWTALARLAQQRGDHDEAISRWEQVRLRFPELAAGHVGGAQALHDAGRIEEAQAILSAAAAKFPDDSELAMRLARTATGRADNETAAKHYRAVSEHSPLRFDALIDLSDALIADGRFDEADQLLLGALDRFQTESSVFSAYATVSMHRQDWAEALRRWEETARRFPQMAQAKERIFEVRLRLAETAPDQLNDDATTEAPKDSEDPTTLVMQFESLGGAGHGCEFGIFQRRFSAEPLGLLRWADLDHNLLTRALETDFEGVGDAEHTELFAPPSERPEYWTRDRRYWMAMRCFIYADQIPYEKMFQQVCRRLQFLRRKLLTDLRIGEKVFVFKCIKRNLTDSELSRLHAAVRRYGENTLLYVRYEDSEHPNGTVEIKADGLMIGYIDHFSHSPSDEHLPDATGSWWRIVQAAHRLWSSGSEPDAASSRELGADAPAPIKFPTNRSGAVVEVKWSDKMLSGLHDDTARRGPSTLQHMIASILLDVSRGDRAMARRRIIARLEQTGSAYIDDGHLFEGILTAAVLASQWDMARTFVNDRFGVDWCAEITAERPRLGGQTVRWEIDRSRRARFAFDMTMMEGDRAWGESLQFNRILSLLHHYSVSERPEPGSVRVSLGDIGIAPGLAFCDNRPDYYLIPDPVFLNTRGYADFRNEVDSAFVPWDERGPLAFWRGSTTGRNRENWRGMQRVQLCFLGQDEGADRLMDVGITSISGMPVGAEAEIKAAGIMRPFVKSTDFMSFKYQIDIDGNTNAWAGLFQKLYTGSPVLKVASPCGFQQWYYDELKPWWNYVPVAADMQDLRERIIWLRSHDEQARLIGERGRALAASMTHARELVRIGPTISAAIHHFSRGSNPE